MILLHRRSRQRHHGGKATPSCQWHISRLSRSPMNEPTASTTALHRISRSKMRISNGSSSNGSSSNGSSRNGHCSHYRRDRNRMPAEPRCRSLSLRCMPQLHELLRMNNANKTAAAANNNKPSGKRTASTTLAITTRRTPLIS